MRAAAAAAVTGMVRRPGVAMHALLVLSGFAGLGYQVVWTRMLSVGLGHEAFAVLAVVAAFFAGLALGALLLDRAVARTRRPGAWYAGLELAIGAWTLALVWLIPWANGVMARLIGPDPSEIWRWLVAFLGTALLLLPSTVAMGATMPAAERLNARLARDGRTLGGLYAANAAGAMLGALLTAAWLSASLGFSGTLLVFAGINLFCAIAMLLGPARGEAMLPPPPPPAAAAGDASAAAAGGGADARHADRRAMLALLAFTGFAGVGFEVAVVRALAQVLENTVYSFAAVLAVYLLGTTLGAAGYQRLYAARRRPGWDMPALGFLAALTGLSAALGVLAMLLLAPQRAALDAGFAAVLGGTFWTEGVLALAALCPAAAAMGAMFAHLAEGARSRDGGLGAAFAANTLGAAAAPLGVGVVAIPALGVVGALGALAGAYLVIAAVALRGGARARTLAAGLAAGGVLMAVFLAPLDRRFAAALPHATIHAQVEGVAATATVTLDGAGERWLTVNGGLVMGGTASYKLDRIQGHAAILRHADPRRALFLGVGTGATMAAAAAYPALRAEGVELLDEVLALVPEFPEAWRDLASAPHRLSLHVADARRHVALPGAPYDVILADTYHPAKDGAGLLYTVEHFAAIRARLSEDGVFVQWLPLHQLDLPMLRLIIRSFQAVFPDARLFLGNANLDTPLLALEGRRDGRPFRLADRLSAPLPPGLREALGEIDYASPFALFGGFLAGPAALATFAGPGPLNTDDRPLVLFEAPRSVYRPLAPAVARTLALIDAFDPVAEEALDVRGVRAGEAFAVRLERYWAARNRFIALGAAQQVAGGEIDPRRTGFALIDILKISPDYAPAFRPAVQMAVAVGAQDREAGYAMLDAIEGFVPGRVETRLARTRIRTR